MDTPSQNGVNVDPIHIEIRVFGHDPAQVQAVRGLFGSGQVKASVENECDLAIFVIDPSKGIDQATINEWEQFDDAMVPRLVAVVGLENSEADFDDAVLLANRVFAPCVTPYLVLHDDVGVACALIRLEDMKILDYSTFPPTLSESENEHQTLVAEFRSEYLEALEIMGPDAFGAGLLFPAIPLWIEKNIGVDIIANYVNELANISK